MNKELKHSIILARGEMCELCGVRRGQDLHHALIHRMKRYPELDTEENFCLLCHQCHMTDGYVNSYEFKCWFWGVQCARYTEERMLDWLRKLPLKVKPRFQ